MKQIDSVGIDELRPHPRNYRSHPPEQVEHIRASIRQFGQYRAIVVSSDNVILCGHGVWEACKAEGQKTISVHRMDFVHNDSRAEKLLVADNELSRLANDDDSALAELLTDVALHEPLLGSGWDEGSLASLVGECCMPDADWVDLPSGDREPFQQMTFTLSDDQAETVKAAMQAALNAGPFVNTGNENSNGNALARVCEAYRG